MNGSILLLAGGKSSRMGQNKALLQLNGKAVIEWVKSRLEPLTQSMLLISNDEELYQFLNLKIVPDIYPNRGPLAGLHAGLTASADELNLVCACDMPFIQANVGEFLVNKLETENCDAVVPVTYGKFHPLFAAYQKSISPIIEQQLQQQNLKMTDLFKRIKVCYVGIEELSSVSNEVETVFYNMNNPSQYQNAIKMMME